MNLPVILLGSGGHAKVLIDVLRLLGISIIGFTDPKEPEEPGALYGIRYLGDDSAVLQYQPNQVQLVNGLGSVGEIEKRMGLFNKFKELGYSFISLVHPSAIIASDVLLGEGVQVMAGAIVQPGCSIDVNTIVNTKASLDHDCVVGRHNHLAPGVTLSGNVRLGDGVHIGTGANVIQGVHIGENTIIGAGALVLNSMPNGVKAFGVPARFITQQ